MAVDPEHLEWANNPPKYRGEHERIIIRAVKPRRRIVCANVLDIYLRGYKSELRISRLGEHTWYIMIPVEQKVVMNVAII